PWAGTQPSGCPGVVPAGRPRPIPTSSSPLLPGQPEGCVPPAHGLTLERLAKSRNGPMFPWPPKLLGPERSLPAAGRGAGGQAATHSHVFLPFAARAAGRLRSPCARLKLGVAGKIKERPNVSVATKAPLAGTQPSGCRAWCRREGRDPFPRLPPLRCLGSLKAAFHLRTV